MLRGRPLARFVALVTLAASLVGCASHGSVDSSPTPMPGFDPGPVPAGYTRYLTPVLQDIAPGTSTIWCQWLTAPLAADEDVLAVTGSQSKDGHHVVLYATTDSEPVGTTRVCTTTDMLSLRFLGFVGGEGGSTSAGTMPPGVAFHLPKGMSLMANVHFINAGSTPIEGQAAIDVETAAPSSSRTMASFFVNTTVDIAIEPRQSTTADVTCVVKNDLSFLMAADHMHTNGVSALTEVVHTDGTSTALVSDPAWNPENQFNPSWARWTVASPYVVHAGETIHTQCTWDNPTSAEITFPDEMCAGLGFFLGDVNEIDCVDGTWGD